MNTKRPNVLVVVLDTVRARSTALDGRDTTPTLAAEMERGTTFQNAIAPSAWSLSSHASLFTGKYPTGHGAISSTQYLQDDQTTLAEKLSAAGYRTGIFTANLYTSGAFNMSRGFDESSFAIRDKLFDGHISVDEFILREDWEGRLALGRTVFQEALSGNIKNVANLIYGKLDGLFRSDENYDQRKQWDKTIVKEATQFIRTSSGDEPFFCFVNLLAGHGPWEFDKSLLQSIGVDPAEYGTDEEWESLASVSENQWPFAAGELTFTERERQMLQLLYESWVYCADKYAGELLAALNEMNRREDTFVVLTADHGEVIAKDRVLGHAASLKNDSLRVPLVVSGPGVDVETIESVVSLKDMYGTVLDRAGIDSDVPSWFDVDRRGEALAETYGVDPDELREYLNGIPDEMARFFELRRRLYTDDAVVERRYSSGEVIGDKHAIQRLDALVDRLETNNVSDRTNEVSGEVADRLEQLGYVQGDSSE